MAHIGPVLPSGWQPPRSDDGSGSSDEESPVPPKDKDAVDDGSYGPALPPDLLEPTTPTSVHEEDEDLDDNYVVGPIPASTSNSEDDYYKRLHMLRGEKAEEEELRNRKRAREEWMTELPSKLSKSYGLTARTFRKHDSGATGDLSTWTETPEERRNRGTKSKADKSKDEEALVAKSNAERDRKYDQEVQMLNAKRGDISLVEMHKKKQKQDQEMDKEKGIKTERRPFDREKDLKIVNLQSAEDRRSTLDKAKVLVSKFEHGSGKKYL